MKHEIPGEKKYGIQTVGIDDLSTSVSQSDRAHASIYQPINYFIGETLFNQLQPDDIKTGFLDAGCGRGRGLAMALYYGFTKVEGFDISPQLCHEAIDIMEPLSKKYAGADIIIECADASEYHIDPNTGVIFIFNPFDQIIMADFIKNVMLSLDVSPRTMKVLYANPQCKKLWLAAGFTETFHLRNMHWLEGSVLSYIPQ